MDQLEQAVEEAKQANRRALADANRKSRLARKQVTNDEDADEDAAVVEPQQDPMDMTMLEVEEWASSRGKPTTKRGNANVAALTYRKELAAVKPDYDEYERQMAAVPEESDVEKQLRMLQDTPRQDAVDEMAAHVRDHNLRRAKQAKQLHHGRGDATDNERFNRELDKSYK